MNSQWLVVEQNVPAAGGQLGAPTAMPPFYGIRGGETRPVRAMDAAGAGACLLSRRTAGSSGESGVSSQSAGPAHLRRGNCLHRKQTEDSMNHDFTRFILSHLGCGLV
jgi:hypothetical protein